MARRGWPTTRREAMCVIAFFNPVNLRATCVIVRSLFVLVVVVVVASLCFCVVSCRLCLSVQLATRVVLCVRVGLEC